MDRAHEAGDDINTSLYYKSRLLNHGEVLFLLLLILVGLL